MHNTAESQAIAQVESIVAMVAALNCDYSRLEELRESAEENKAIVAAYSEKMDDWQANADATAELEELAELESQAGENADREDAERAIQEDPLSVEVRSGWTTATAPEFEAEEFRIVLCTGGPHVEIVGTIDGGMPNRVRVLYRDWGTSGELFDFDHDAVITYCQQFYFGE
jgi:hypothetical protein